MSKLHPHLIVVGRRAAVLCLLPLAAGAAADEPTAAPASLPPLPAAVASFGAAVNGDGLYVYGGHVGRTHQHSITNLSHAFFHLDLAAPESGWRQVEEVRGLQGLPMVAHGSEVCRVGGLSARNAADEEEDLVSIDAVRCYDTAAGGWRDLPPLPAPRSSHDAAVLDGKLYAVGGWQLRGADEDPVWHDRIAVFDLTVADAAWETFEQPFERRALAVAAAGGKLFAFGGLGHDGTSREVDVLDPATGSWTSAPELPEMTGRLKGFGVSAFGVGDRVFLSGADGVVHALDVATLSWQTGLGELATPRFFHRLLPHGERLLFVGGASSEGHLADVETLPLGELTAGRADDPAAGEMAAGEEKTAEAAGDWPGFRGRGDGHATLAELPIEWSDDSVAWRASLPGYGQSSPVVWDGRVYITSAEVPRKDTLIVSALDLADGEVLWRRRFPASQVIEDNGMVSKSAPTPAADASGLYVFFESGDLLALSHEGETLWRRSLTDEYGAFEGNHGVGSSLRLTDSAVLVQVTHDGPSYYLAVDKASGGNRWKADRPAKVSWNTPLLLDVAGGTTLVSSAAGRVEAIDADTGEVLWSRNGIEKNHVPSAVADRELVVVASSDPGESFALRRTASGAVDPDAVAWRVDGVTSGFGSPVIHGPCVAFVNKAGVVSCVDRTTGAERWKHRLAEATWASPIVAGDRVWFFGKDGSATVLRFGEDGAEPLAEGSLELEGPVYGVAAVRGALIVRTGSEVIRIGPATTKDG